MKKNIKGLLFCLLSGIMPTTCEILYAQIYMSQNVTLLSHWDNPNQPILTTFGSMKYNGSWGWTDTIKHREYALVGSVTGTYFIDVTDPYNPIERDYLPGCNDTIRNIHREIKSYSHYAYIMSEECGSKGLQIVDMKYLPDSVHLVSDTTKFRSHTLYIDVPNVKLYLTGVKAYLLNQNYFSGLDVYDLTNPEIPSLLRSIETDYPGLVAGAHDCFARNDTIYFSDQINGYFVFKQSDTSAFTLLGTFNGCAHSSWLTDNGKYAVGCDEISKQVIKILDLQDISNINMIGNCISRPDTSAIHHNPFVVGNDRVIVACYTDGVQIFDLSDPSNPVKTGYFDTFYQNDTAPLINNYIGCCNYMGCWGVYPYLKSKHLLALDMQNGLYVMDASPALKVVGLKNPINLVQVYPNPATFVLTITGITNKSTIKLYDILGCLVLEKEVLKNTTLDISQLGQGVYSLITESTKLRATNKVVISR